jgi:hypothetical protein
MAIFNSYVSLPEGTKSPTIFPVYSSWFDQLVPIFDTLDQFTAPLLSAAVGVRHIFHPHDGSLGESRRPIREEYRRDVEISMEISGP